VARIYSVDLQRLRRCVKASQSRSTRTKTNQKLTEAQIKAVKLYIYRLDLIGQPPLLSMVRAAAELIQYSTTPLAERAALGLSASREKAEQDLRAQTVAARHKQRRQVSDRRVIQSGRSVYIHDARLRAAKRNKKDEQKGSHQKSVTILNVLKANNPPPRRQNTSSSNIG
jgi:hypothetical protein